MHLDAVRDLLRKQKIVEGLVKNQSAAHPGLVESVTERQHTAEMENFMAKLAVHDIVEVLQALPPEGDVLIAGSLYLAGEVLRLNLEFPD